MVTGYTSDYSSIWSSPDGITWTQEVINAPYSQRTNARLEVLDDKLWLIGGTDASWDWGNNDVWSSTDGINWMPITNDAPWPKRHYAMTAVHNGELWLLGGLISDNWVELNDVWKADKNPTIVYTVCWDTVEGGCAFSAETTDLSFTLPNNLDSATWYFSVKSVNSLGQTITSLALDGYSVDSSIGLPKAGVGQSPFEKLKTTWLTMIGSGLFIGGGLVAGRRTKTVHFKR